MFNFVIIIIMTVFFKRVSRCTKDSQHITLLLLLQLFFVFCFLSFQEGFDGYQGPYNFVVIIIMTAYFSGGY